jgi:putative ABC transport system permease protein
MRITRLTLACRNWTRRPLRTAVTATGVAIAVAALFSLLAFQDGYRAGIQSDLGRLGAHILVVPKGCPYDAASIALHGATWPCYLKADYLEEVRSVVPDAAIAPAFMAAFSDGDETQAVYVGIDDSLLPLKTGWRIDGHFPAASGDLLIGADVARRHHWSVLQTVDLPGLGNQRGRVSGVLARTGGADDRFIYLNLADAQRVFHHEGELTHILVRLWDPNQLDPAVAQLRGCNAGMEMNVVPLAHLFRTIQSLVNSTRLWLGCVTLVALAVAGAGVSNTILMAVAERTREIGVMRAVGAGRGDIFRLIWLETIQVCLAGGTAGILVAFAASRGIESWLRTRVPYAPADALIRWEWWIAAACLGGALAVGSLAGCLPAWRAASLSPIEAIRSQGGGRA